MGKIVFSKNGENYFLAYEAKEFYDKQIIASMIIRK